MTDLIGGQVQVMFDTMAASIPHIKGGKVRALAVTTAARSALLPDLPTVGDFVPGYEASGPFGLGAPKDTPPGSSTSSTGRSTRCWPIPRSRRALPISAASR